MIVFYSFNATLMFCASYPITESGSPNMDTIEIKTHLKLGKTLRHVCFDFGSKYLQTVTCRFFAR